MEDGGDNLVERDATMGSKSDPRPDRRWVANSVPVSGLPVAANESASSETFL